MNLSVSDDKKDVVEGFMLLSSDSLRYLVKHMREVSGSTQGNLRHVLSVDI